MNPKSPETWTWFSNEQAVQFFELGMLLVLNDFSYDRNLFYTWQTRPVDECLVETETVRAKSYLVLEITTLDESYLYHGFNVTFLTDVGSVTNRKFFANCGTRCFSPDWFDHIVRPGQSK